MDIVQFIKYINRRKGWNVQGGYYAYIREWRQWWQGNYAPFHTVKSAGLDGRIHARQMYRLRMPKRVSEDWASLLLNDKTTVTVKDAASAKWLCGNPDSHLQGGQLRALDFWSNANRLVELAFRSGTGAFVMSAQGVAVDGGAVQSSPSARLALDYLPAECILPITVRHGKVVDVAFASEVIVGGRSCVYLQTHQLEDMSDGGRQYVIYNEYYAGEGEGELAVDYQPAELPHGMLKSIKTGSDTPWFSVFSPAIVKNLDGGAGLGMAVFAEALDTCKQVDLAFDNYCMDLYLGGKKVFYSKEMLKPLVDKEGNVRYSAPDDIRQQLFYQLGDSNPDTEPKWYEYNPDLRTEANSRAVQDALDYTSFLCGLGTHRYQFQGSAIATATQYMGDRQDMVQHANRHQIQIEEALLQIFRALLWAGRNLLGADVDPETDISINWDDSYIDTAESRRVQDKDDALSGFIPKYRYNMEWRGMSEEDAKAAVREAREESGASDPLSFGGSF